jgi:hypothetical protein
MQSHIVHKYKNIAAWIIAFHCTECTVLLFVEFNSRKICDEWTAFLVSSASKLLAFEDITQNSVGWTKSDFASVWTFLTTRHPIFDAFLTESCLTFCTFARVFDYVGAD